jgi:hypothetical protein
MIKYRPLGLLLMLVTLGLTACGGHDDGPPPEYTSQISSDPAYDGDIQQTAPSSYLVTQGMSTEVQSVFAGINPADSTEYRAFLDFPLGGATGVPSDAVIDTAFLDFYVNSLQPGTGTLPIRIELVAFQPPTLFPTDFDRTAQPPLAYITLNPPINANDNGTNVSVDVTPLMVEAQRRGLVDFQVRILEDLGPAIPVLMEINDSTGANRPTVGPLLTVNFF